MQTQESLARRDLGRVGRLAIWTLVWVATLAVASFGPEFLWNRQPVASWIAVVVNIAAGAAWIVAHARFLGGVDELQRKIMLDAIAAALGVGLVSGMATSAAEGADLIVIESDLAIVTVVMAVVYMAGVAIGTLRYR